MKNRIFAFFVVLVLAGGLLWFVPFPSRINVTRTGWLISDTGEILADDVQITLTGWKYHFLLHGDTASVAVTAVSEINEAANLTQQMESGARLWEIENPGLSYCFISAPTYHAETNGYTSITVNYTDDFQEILITLGIASGYWLAADGAESPENCALPAALTLSAAQDSAAEIASGVPGGEEIAAYEALYGKDMEEVLDALNLKAEDAVRQDEVSLVYEQARTIEGVSFGLTLNFGAESGFYGFTLNAGLPSDTEDLTGTVQKIYDAAAAGYGTPATYEGLSEILSAQLEAGEHTGQEDWTVGEGSTCRMSVSDYEDETVITLAYQTAAEE